ncbi:glycerate kinase [Aspergillus pseudonomiae]|uniref:Glycerate kinase n=1 Tax=Aspergillus pseudonomiae TaxID=1506151 RepID=A0A5N7DMW7_9EURO|nr:glycerate kinase [Aspergillus pseudonomiae]KAE8407399.1 glycerate kinase [Aspergillus pseudonomiae]
MNILVCPSGFKGSIDPQTAANCIEAGIMRALPSAKIRKVPLADGGEGFTHALVAATDGQMREAIVTGPVGAPISSFYGVIAQGQCKTAVIEIAAAAGLSLVPYDCRNPSVTTTFGVGELIASALDEGVQRIIVGCGDSGTSDGGAGMLQALGARLINREGTEIPWAAGGQSLIPLESIDLSGLHPRLKEVEIEVACNWKNVLCGPNGVACTYGPQKGASPKQTKLLQAALDIYASVCKRILGHDVSEMPGSGASGGLGTGLLLLGAMLRPRYEAIMEYFNLDGLFEDCDLVFTAEGGIDYQTPRGKIPAEVAIRAKNRQIPVIVLAGTIGDEAEVNYDVGINAYASILQRPSTLDEAIAEAERLLTESAEGVMRMVVIGRKLARW